MRIFSLHVRDQFDPVDGTTLGRLLRPNDPDVILCMAGYHAGLTSRAFI
jgi:hypothetical protein